MWHSNASAAKDTAGRDHWAFQPPASNGARGPKRRLGPQSSEIGSFWRSWRRGKAPSPPAARATLLRRVSLDLTGLPPTPEELSGFLNDRAPNAYEKVVDRLLASPHYGERWGRHWLDLARYADRDGYANDDPRHIWEYRDWVIDALNRDMPFDQFTIEQIAGDLLPDRDAGPDRRDRVSPQHAQQRRGGHRPRGVSGGSGGRTASTPQAQCLLGSPSDAPVPRPQVRSDQQKEFYQLFAYLNNTAEITKESERPQHNRPKLELPTPEQAQAWNQYPVICSS